MVGTSQLLHTAQQSDSAKTSPLTITIYVLQGKKKKNLQRLSGPNTPKGPFLTKITTKMTMVVDTDKEI
jgi:hypothetical protein